MMSELMEAILDWRGETLIPSEIVEAVRELERENARLQKRVEALERVRAEAMLSASSEWFVQSGAFAKDEPDLFGEWLEIEWPALHAAQEEEE